MNTSKFIEFAKMVGKLKEIERQGWLNSQIKNPESVADHTFRVTLLALILTPQLGLDQLKAVKMALIHDLGEAEIGDIVILEGSKYLKNRSQKEKLEREAFRNIVSLIDQEEYLDLFEEYEEGKTKEAKFIKQLDKLEMRMQALEYEDKHKVNLQPFFDSAKVPGIKPEGLLKKLSKVVERLRKK